MSEMLDRIAQVMCDFDNAHWPTERDRYRSRATTLLNTMMAPTGAMEAASARIPHATDRQIYQAMIGAAVAP